MDEFIKEYGKYIPYAYFAIISIVAFFMTTYDKKAAKKKPDQRVPEAKLFTVAILGGSIVMYTTMLMIHHKTKHLQFMVGLPIIMVLQFAIAFALLIIF